MLRHPVKKRFVAEQGQGARSVSALLEADAIMWLFLGTWKLPAEIPANDCQAALQMRHVNKPLSLKVTDLSFTLPRSIYAWQRCAERFATLLLQQMAR